MQKNDPILINIPHSSTYIPPEEVGSMEEILKDLNDTDFNSLIRSLIRHSHNVQAKIS